MEMKTRKRREMESEKDTYREERGESGKHEQHRFSSCKNIYAPSEIFMLIKI